MFRARAAIDSGLASVSGSPGCRKLLLCAVDQGQQLSDRSMRFIVMSERLIGLDSVAVLAADFFTIDDSAGLEIGDDPLYGPLGDSDLQCHLSKHQRRISRQDHQHVRMIRQKSPMSTGRFR